MKKREAEQKIKEITEKIVKEYQPEKIILFGSWAWGEPGLDSDVDLFIIKDATESRFNRERKVKEIIWGSNMPLDILVYTPEEVRTSININHNLFIEDIIRNGRILYAKSESEFIVPLPQRELAVV